MMENGNKYIPPHLRGNSSALNPTAPQFQPGRSEEPQRRDSNPRGGGYNNGGRDYYGGGRNDFYGGGGGSRGEYQGGGYNGGYNRGGYRNGGGDYGGYRSKPTPRTNELGFHGNMRRDENLESQLFGSQNATGINFDKYDDIPVETSGRDCPVAISSFDEAELPESLRRNLELCGFSKPTPIQKHAIPIGLSQRDMMACAQTGSGKTGGFLFPVLTMLLRDGPAPAPEENGAGMRYRKSLPNALVLAPTRELASQINDEAMKFAYLTGIQPVCVYGGADIKEQTRILDRGCDLLVATPGRLVDLIERGRVSLACVKFLVLDEADRMLDMGFEPQIRRIVTQEDLPKKRRTFMFSATFPKEIQRLASDFLEDYVFITVGRVGGAAGDILQRIEYCADESQKQPFLMKCLGDVSEGLVLVFVETRRAADLLENTLQKAGYPTTSIHGDRTQPEREEALNLFKTGRKPILVATDVAARGLDIANVGFVINYDMPNNIDDYVHRIGRTGRAGNKGTAISMMSDKNRGMAKELYELLSENKQTVPQWLKVMATQSSMGSGSRGRGRGRGGGSRDFREDRGGGRGRYHNNGSMFSNGAGNSSSWSRNVSSTGSGRGSANAQVPPPGGDDAW